MQHYFVPILHCIFRRYKLFNTKIILFTILVQIPKKLHEVPFHVMYLPPSPIDPNLRKKQEQIEEELKKQEEELDKLMFITLT